VEEVCKNVFKEENMEVRKEIFMMIVDRSNRDHTMVNDAVK
jgi:hypothetical protein